MMRVQVDGIIFQQQRRGGVSRVFREMLPRMCRQDDDICFDLFLSGPLRQPIPRHPRIVSRPVLPVDAVLKPNRVWWKLQVGLRVRGWAQRAAVPADAGLWHSTYYTPAPVRLPTLVTVHDLIHERLPDVYRGWAATRFRQRKAHAIRAADLVVCVSRTTAADVVAQLVPRAPVAVVPLGVGDAFRPLEPDSEAKAVEPYLLYVGRRDPHKNFDALVGAFRGWPRAGEVRLVVAGPPPSDGERRQLTDLVEQGRLSFRTGTSDAELCKLYNQALALVHPSLYEGFGLPVLEAMTCGCPVVASRIPATQELAGNVPHYFDPASREELLAALDAAYDGQDRDRCQQGMDRAAGYTWEASAARMLQLYRGLVG
jgi:glycosyltransferase involved in cell wall biosynthesis